MLRTLLCYYKYWGRNLNEYPNISRENSFLFRGNSTIQFNRKKTNEQIKQDMYLMKVTENLVIIASSFFNLVVLN